MQRERDVAVQAAAGRAASAAVKRRSDSAPVEQEDRLPAFLREPAELGEEWRGERVAHLVAQVDDADGRHRRRDPAAELEPFERVPGLRSRCRRAEDRDRTLERRSLGGDGASVVPRIGLLLVRGVVLLVDADHPERRERREHGRPRADDDRSLARDDPLPLVAPLSLGQARVEKCDAVTEARAETAERLWRERDLGHEHDRAAARGKRRLACADVDLGLAAAGRAFEQDVAAAAHEQDRDPRERALLRLRELGRRRLRGQRGRRQQPRAARRDAPAGTARRGRGHAQASSRSSPRPRARDRRGPAATSRGRARLRPARRPAAPRRRHRPRPRGGARSRNESQGQRPSPPRRRSRT